MNCINLSVRACTAHDLNQGSNKGVVNGGCATFLNGIYKIVTFPIFNKSRKIADIMIFVMSFKAF